MYLYRLSQLPSNIHCFKVIAYFQLYWTKFRVTVVYVIRTASILHSNCLSHFSPYRWTRWTVLFKAEILSQGNCATKGNSGNCQSGNCHSRERWMRKPSVHIHGGKWKSNEGIDNIANGPVNNMSFYML